MSESGKGSSTDIRIFIDCMARTTFFTEAFNPAKTNRKVCKQSAQSINVAGT